MGKLYGSIYFFGFFLLWYGCRFGCCYAFSSLVIPFGLLTIDCSTPKTTFVCQSFNCQSIKYRSNNNNIKIYWQLSHIFKMRDFYAPINQNAPFFLSFFNTYIHNLHTYRLYGKLVKMKSLMGEIFIVYLSLFLT